MQTSLPWVTSSPECGLRPQLEALFQEAGCGVPTGIMADTEGAVLGMVASGLGAGLMRRDQAIEAERAGQAIIWNGWQGRTWLCWAQAPPRRWKCWQWLRYAMWYGRLGCDVGWIAGCSGAARASWNFCCVRFNPNYVKFGARSTSAVPCLNAAAGTQGGSFARPPASC